MTVQLRLPDAGDVEAARVNIAGIARRTPLWKLDHDQPGMEIWLKLENLQPLGSFKIRAGVNAMKALDPNTLGDGVLGASAGNFGQGLAFAARAMGVPVTIMSRPMERRRPRRRPCASSARPSSGFRFRYGGRR